MAAIKTKKSKLKGKKRLRAILARIEETRDDLFEYLEEQEEYAENKNELWHHTDKGQAFERNDQAGNVAQEALDNAAAHILEILGE